MKPMWLIPREEKSLHLWFHFLSPPLHTQLCQEISYIPEMARIALKLSPTNWARTFSVTFDLDLAKRELPPSTGSCQM